MKVVVITLVVVRLIEYSIENERTIKIKHKTNVHSLGQLQKKKEFSTVDRLSYRYTHFSA